MSGEHVKPLLALAANDGWNIVNYRAPLIRGLLSAGYRIAVLAPDGPHSDAIRATGVEFHPIAMRGRGKSPLGDLRTLAAYLSILRRLRPAAFLGFTAKPNIYGSLAAHSLHIPVINNISGLGAVFVTGGPLRMLVSRMYRLALARSSTVFFQNPDDRREFVAAGLVGEERTALLPGSGVDLEHFAPRKGGSDGPVTFLFAARLLWAKGIAEFVEAARLLKSEGVPAKFEILGIIEPESPTTVPLSAVQQWQREGVVEYLGASHDVRDALAAADCVVLPSFYREGVPRVLLEAAAMALPIITTDAPGCREAVDDGVSGLLCAPRSVESLAAAMRRMAALGPSERQTMGAAGREKMERSFDSTIVNHAYLKALAKLYSAASKG